LESTYDELKSSVEQDKTSVANIGQQQPPPNFNKLFQSLMQSTSKARRILEILDAATDGEAAILGDDSITLGKRPRT